MDREVKLALALGGFAFAWGVVKSYGVAKVGHSATCTDPVACSRRELDRTSTMDVVKTVAVAPWSEETMFRAGIQSGYDGMLGKGAGLGVTSALFGAIHADPRKGVSVSNALRVTDAGLGGLLYGTAYNLAGLPASVGAHALHNLGCHVGLLLGVHT